MYGRILKRVGISMLWILAGYCGRQVAEPYLDDLVREQQPAPPAPTQPVDIDRFLREHTYVPR